MGVEVKINVDKLNETLAKGKARQAQLAREKSGSQEVPTDVASRPRGITFRGHSYDSLADFVASGDFRRLIVRPDGRSGGSWTLKGVLLVRETSQPVYMHGQVTELWEVLPLIDRLLRQGSWHQDRYPSKEDL